MANRRSTRYGVGASERGDQRGPGSELLFAVERKKSLLNRLLSENRDLHFKRIGFVKE